MHIPEKWKIKSTDKIQSFIHQYGFASVISSDLEASHLPLLLKADEGEFGVLYGHFSRANPQWRNIDNTEVLVIFSGPHAYISPQWYVNQPAVPTWNYSAVHVKGIIELTDEKSTGEMLSNLIRKYEPELLIEDFIPQEYKNKLSKGIVGFKIRITSMEGKEKLGQHRSLVDQQGVVAGLSQSNINDAISLLKYMKDENIGTGK
ncbi:transcriptional regulator [Veronia nyctiphanis]|uniref:Transcriptional regulator n=1 Tax=Veronia nyctiphanis TaxID=1278244 RepID=A0A4Q0YMV2_9GAMM|nr:FMN-binding negative transcriptional regulator [Veronia nyctiphanis]RXJ72232.1 transcriptional regulator [Veronia nyctiphanis]